GEPAGAAPEDQVESLRGQGTAPAAVRGQAATRHDVVGDDGVQHLERGGLVDAATRGRAVAGKGDVLEHGRRVAKLADAAAGKGALVGGDGAVLDGHGGV